MSLPRERSSAVVNTRQFLFDLLDPKKTPKVPSYVRDQAYSLLKHYPNKFDINEAAKTAPESFGRLPKNT